VVLSRSTQRLLASEKDIQYLGVRERNRRLGLGTTMGSLVGWKPFRSWARRKHLAKSVTSLLTCLATFVVAASLIPAPPLRAADQPYEVRQLAPHTFVWVPDDIMDQNGDPNFSRSGNVGFVITPDGVVVINTANNPFHAREVLYEIRQRTDLPVRLVIDTGPQADEVLGNEVFAEQRATIIASSGTEAQMRSYQSGLVKRMSLDPELPRHMRGIHLTFPTQTFQGTVSFNLGGQEIRVLSLNCDEPGDAEGDAAVFLPREKVLFLGDLYVNGYVPQIGSRNVQRWIDALANVEKWNATTYVPGHGDPSTAKTFANFRGFLQWLQAGVQAGIQQGKSLSAVEDQLLSSSAFNLRALDLAPKAIAAVYNQLARARAAHVTPDRSAPSPVPQSRTANPATDSAVKGFLNRISSRALNGAH
jgi:glyoxylase-like metal-dependent hydrolase (beta-lactamase superfamily II)